MLTPEENGLYIPKFVVHTLTLLGTIDDAFSIFVDFIFEIFRFLGQEPSSRVEENKAPAPFEPPLSAILIREILPVVKFRDDVDEQPPPECAVCLNEFEDDQEIRCLRNCQHFYHRVCIDRWMDQDRKTCPLCRKFLVPLDYRVEFDRKLRAAF